MNHLPIDTARWPIIVGQDTPLALRLAALYSRDVADHSTPTATTVGFAIHWNPTWLATLTQEEVDWVVRHELLHLTTTLPASVQP